MGNKQKSKIQRVYGGSHNCVNTDLKPVQIVVVKAGPCNKMVKSKGRSLKEIGSHIFHIQLKSPFQPFTTNMANFVALRHPVTILVTDFTYPDNSHSQLIEFLYLFVSESIILHVKNVFFLGKTLEEFWCKPKKHIFASFFHLFTFFMQKT